MYRQNKTPWIRLVALSLMVLFSTSGFDGCSQGEPEGEPQLIHARISGPRNNIYLQDPVEKDSALVLLASMDTRYIKQAFDALDGLSYTEYKRIDQFDELGLLSAYLEYITRITSPTSRLVIASDSAGSFDYGFFQKLRDRSHPARIQKNINRYINPRRPIFLTNRGQDLFVFRILPDTLMWDHMAHAVEILARPGVGDLQGLKMIRFFIDRATRTLIGMTVVQTDLTMFYREYSTYYLDIRPFRDRWVPHNARVETFVHVPFAHKHHYRTVFTFKDFEPPSPSI